MRAARQVAALPARSVLYVEPDADLAVLVPRKADKLVIGEPPVRWRISLEHGAHLKQ